jgi:hypothetical protein
MSRGHDIGKKSNKKQGTLRPTKLRRSERLRQNRLKCGRMKQTKWSKGKILKFKILTESAAKQRLIMSFVRHLADVNWIGVAATRSRANATDQHDRNAQHGTPSRAYSHTFVCNCGNNKLQHTHYHTFKNHVCKI